MKSHLRKKKKGGRTEDGLLTNKIINRKYFCTSCFTCELVRTEDNEATRRRQKEFVRAGK
jgi:hypothetical protein